MQGDFVEEKKKLVPPPYTIKPFNDEKKLVDPPYSIRIDLKPPPYHIQLNDDVQKGEEILADSQYSVSTAKVTRNIGQPSPISGYSMVKSENILPRYGLETRFSPPLQQFPNDVSSTPFFPLYEEDASKLAYEAASANIAVSKEFGMESAKTVGLYNRTRIEVDGELDKAAIEVNKQVKLNEAEFFHKSNMKTLEVKNVVENNIIENEKLTIHYLEKFIYTVQLVALTSKFFLKSNFFCLDLSKGMPVGHEPVDDKFLEGLLKWFFQQMVGDEADSYNFKKLLAKLKNLTPLLGSKECDLKILPEEQQIFQNGIYDIKENVFWNFNGNERIFGRFPLNVNFFECDMDKFPDTYGFPYTKFDEMLDDIFDGDEKKINLAFQIIGAIISNVSLKHIFVFQGGSGTGKTALTDVICALLGEDKCNLLSNFAKLNKENTERKQEDLNAYKLIVVRDAADKSVTSTQLSLLKNFADGTKINEFKLIINTNNRLYTSKDEDGVMLISDALLNRLVVLPFEKKMSRSYARVDTEEYIKGDLSKEKAVIITKSLIAFSHYYEKLANGRPKYQFYHDFPVNAVIDDEVIIM